MFVSYDFIEHSFIDINPDLLRVVIFGISKSRNGILDIEIEVSNVIKFFDTEYFASLKQ